MLAVVSLALVLFGKLALIRHSCAYVGAVGLLSCVGLAFQAQKIYKRKLSDSEYSFDIKRGNLIRDKPSVKKIIDSISFPV